MIHSTALSRVDLFHNITTDDMVRIQNNLFYDIINLPPYVVCERKTFQISGKWEDGSLHGPVKIYYDGYFFKGRYNDNLVGQSSIFMS